MWIVIDIIFRIKLTFVEVIDNEKIVMDRSYSVGH